MVRNACPLSNGVSGGAGPAERAAGAGEFGECAGILPRGAQPGGRARVGGAQPGTAGGDGTIQRRLFLGQRGARLALGHGALAQRPRRAGEPHDGTHIHHGGELRELRPAQRAPWT